MSILAWNQGSCPVLGSGIAPRPYGTCCYKYADGVWLLQANNSVNGGVCDAPTQQGDYYNTYVLVECHAPGKSS
jgi:hypothetical protein